MNLATQKTWLVAAVFLAAFTVLFTACSPGGDSENQQSGSNLVDTGQSQSSNSASTSTPSRPPTTTSEVDDLDPEATAQPGAPANVRVPTSEVTLDSLTIALSVQAARRMVAGNTSSIAPTAQPQQQQNNQGRQQMRRWC